MSKELFISSSPHETKVAVLEEDQLVEVFFQRDTDVGLVGGIYKGRVSRVLPGMQSAFVDIGLERDAFLYVSDFFEESEEYDRVLAEAEGRVGRLPEQAVAPSTGTAPVITEPGAQTAPSAAEAGTPGSAPTVATEQAASSVTEVSSTEGAGTETAPSQPAAAPAGASDFTRRSESRGRGRRRRGRMFGGRPEPRPPRPAETSPGSFEVLPGESLAKYRNVRPEGEAGASESPAVGQAAELANPPEPESTSEPAAGPQVPVERAESPTERTSSRETSPVSAVSEPDRSRDHPNLAPPAQPERSPQPVEANEAVAALGVFPEPPVSPAGTGRDTEEQVESELLAGDLRVAPVNFEPDAPIHDLAGAGQIILEQLSTTAGEAPPATGEEVGTNAPPQASAGSEETGEATEISEVPPAMEDSGASAAVEGEAPSVAAVGEPAGDRAYTVREQHQRPRFASRRGRRGRGRFGPRGPRPEGGLRRDYSRSGNEQPVQINELLKEGQEILVQIAKEPLGTKGARITSHVALPGRYLVYMPTIHHTGVSRKIASEEERLRLRNIILEHRGELTGGIIVRTAAAGRSEEELKADLQFLGTLWADIRARAERAKAPALIHRDLTLVERLLRDILSPDFKSLRVDNEIEYQNALEFVHRFQPSLVGHVKLYTKDAPMFEEFGIQGEIDKALKPKVWLKSGGYIVINQTEALVAIDVNTGKYVGKTNRLEDTIVKTNVDAVKEIVRQVRLRDLGGIIVIDFIDMDDRRNRLKVVQALEEELRADRAPTKILSFNEFGLVALTRKRVKQSLERTLSESCPYCSGSGWVKSVNTVCYEIMEEARKMAREIEGDVLTFRVNPEVARALKSREGVLISELESLTGKDVVIKGDPSVHQERYEIY